MESLGGVFSSETAQKCCDAIYFSDESQDRARGMRFRSGETVFCKIDEALAFFERLRLTRRRIVLVTGQGDLPCDAWRQRFLPANVHHWFATNVTNPHPKVTCLPLGLGAESDRVTLRCDEILAARDCHAERRGWLYVNFRPETNVGIRKPLFEHFASIASRNSWVSFQPPDSTLSKSVYARALAAHRFVLCPPGNGVDTHRMWEALVAGAIPVVLRSPVTECFSALPILQVDDLTTITKDMLEANWSARGSQPAWEMLGAKFWLRKIAEKRAEVEIAGPMEIGEWLLESARYGLAIAQRRLFRV